MNISDTGKGHAIIMVHGWGMTRLVFEPLAELLSEKFRVISFDLPGHGEAKNQPAPYDFHRYSHCIKDVVEQTGVSEFSLLGWSMGGTVCAIYCAQKEEPAPKSLILVGSTPRFIAPDKNFLEGASLTKLRRMKKMIKRDHETALRNFLGDLFEPREVTSSKQRFIIDQLLAPISFPPKMEAMFETLDQFEKTDLTAHRSDYTGKVLLIHGSLDKIAPIGGQKMWRKVFNNVEDISFIGAGHAVHMTRCHQVAKSIEDFLN